MLPLYGTRIYTSAEVLISSELVLLHEPSTHLDD